MNRRFFIINNYFIACSLLVSTSLKPFLNISNASVFSVTVDKNKCNGCEECVKACPAKVFDFEKNKPIVAREDECLGCEACVEVCPQGAINIKYPSL